MEREVKRYKVGKGKDRKAGKGEVGKVKGERLKDNGEEVEWIIS